ncbi:MAG: DUF4837 family protein [Paludibacteraceae bacterium]|nr:DUF4837 family protein [Paludibacteraceae bacterium]
MSNNRLPIFTTSIVLLAMLVFSSCRNTSRTLPTATGSIYECVVVCSDDVYRDLVSPTMAADMPCLPQMEPYFHLSHVTAALFDDFLKSARNVLVVETDPTLPQVKALYSRDWWSKPQAVCRIKTPDQQALAAWWQEYGEAVRTWFVREELSRQVRFLKGGTNKDARAALRQNMQCDMLIPEDYMLIRDSTDLIWCCNNKGPMRRDLIIYRYPYTDTLQFTYDALCQKRDAVLGQVVTASLPGSYMGTEYRIFPPQMQSIRPLQDTLSTSSFYAYEMRGLWRIMQGEAMGGPFVSHTRLDPVNGQIITAEVFIYAAGQKKRNALRQAEAILYTLQLPDELSSHP